MKQHITLKQLREIGFEKAAKIVYDNKFIELYVKEWEQSEHKEVWELNLAKRINIGTMIEFLENESLSCDIEKKRDTVSEAFEGWEIYVFRVISTDNFIEITHVEQELCDSLWEASKVVLKENK